MIKVIPAATNKITSADNKWNNVAITNSSTSAAWSDRVAAPTYITDIRRYIKLDGTEELQLKISGNWQRIDVQYEASEVMEKL